MWRRIRKAAFSLPMRIGAGLFAAYLLAGFFLVDPAARRLLPWVGEKLLASRLDAQRVDFNPLTLELRVRGLALADGAGAPLAGFEQLYLDLDSGGLARWAWRIRTVQLESPRVHVEVRRGGALNWDALLARLREDPGEPSDTMARVLVDHLRIAGGHVRYVDANRAGPPFDAAFTPLGIELEGLSTLPEDRGDYVIAARLPGLGGTLRWKGDIGLNPLASQGRVELEGARIDQLARAVPGPLPAAVSGTVGTALHYRFAMLRGPDHADVPSLQVTGGQALLRDFALAPAGGGEPLLQVAEGRVSDASFDLIRREIAVGAVRLDRGRVAATRGADGALDWATLAVAPAAQGTGAAPPAAAAHDGAVLPWKFTVRQVQLAGWSARYTDQTYATPLVAVADTVDATAALAGEAGAATTLALGPLEAAVGPVRLASGGEPVASLRRAALSGATVQLPGNRIAVEAVDLGGARALVAVDRKQRLNWQEILRAAPGAQGAGTPAADASAPLPDLRIARVRADDIELQFRDASQGAPVALDLVQGTIALQDVGLDLQKAIPVEAGFAVRQGGRLQARGTVVPGKPSGRLDLRMAGVSLKPFAPYLNQFARLDLQRGRAGTHGRLAFAPGSRGLKLDFSGGFSVDDLVILEEDTGEAFLGWEKFSSDSVSVALAPDRVHIRELVALKPFGKLIIFEDQTLNLQRLRRSGPAPVAATAPPPSAAPFPLAVERLRVVDARMEFADLSLRPQFGTAMHELGGVVTGLSTDPAASAQVELDGKVDEYGSARIRGSIQPFRATEATDLVLAFRNLEMARLTPYSGKFAGRRIESGRLSVDLEYKIRQRQLAGTNKFVVNRLKLGERVDSPDAMKLPLDLAIALLEDSDGVIDLDLPVSGSLDDPQFSYGAIVWKAIVNVLTKIVTAPFRALGALLGGGAEKFEAVGFDPGSSTLLPPEQEKLKLLAGALAKRPALTLAIRPGYDPAADRRALQDAAMRREAAAAAGTALAAGEPAGPVDVNNYKVQTWLEDRYRERAGRKAYQELRAGHRSQDAGAVARVLDTEFVERLGRRFKSRDEGPPSAFHAELLERLARQVPVPDEALVALAQARADALRQELLKLGQEEARVTIAPPAPRPLKDKMVGTGLELGARQLPRAAAAAGG